MKFFDIILRPQETMIEKVQNVNMHEANRTVAIYGGIVGLLFGIMLAVAGIIFGTFAAAFLKSIPVVGAVAGLGILAIIIMPIVAAIIFLVFSHIGFHIIHFIAKLFGGTGTFQNNFYLGSKLLWPSLVANIVIFVLSLIPIAGILINFIWSLYSLYVFIVLVSVANNISRIKALIIILLPSILLTTVIAMAALVVLVNPTTVQGDFCDAKFGPFVATQTSIGDSASQFVFVNQSGRPATINSVVITGISNSGKPFSSNSTLSETFDISETKSIVISHPPLGVGPYNLTVEFNYDMGNLKGATAKGTCRGTN